jgi:PPOX class probable F420-dependent enzyme
MAETMTTEQWRAFLAEGTRTGKLATTLRDGSPHVVPIWFVLDGDDLVFNTGRDTAKGRSIRRDGRVAICVDDERAPFAFVTVRGRATVSADAAELLPWATRIAARYMGQARAAEFGARNAVEGELLVRVRIERVTAFSGVSD